MNVLGELQRAFPLHWDHYRGYSLPQRELGEPYYIQWSGEPWPIGEGWLHAPYGDDGIISLGAYRNPVSIAQFALAQHARALRGDQAAKHLFLRHAQWFYDVQEPDGAFRYPIDLPIYGVRKGWVSAMAQGEAASVLLRAFALTQAVEYREAGLRALAPLAIDVQHGGASYLRGGDIFFEEVASEKPCHILNGHLYAAFALWEYVEHGIATGDQVALHHAAAASLERHIAKYDIDGWSAYDLACDERGMRHYAPLSYHHFHIAQLSVYAAMTGRHQFEAMAARWSAALDRFSVRRRVWEYGAYRVRNGVKRRLRRAQPAAFIPPAAP